MPNDFRYATNLWTLLIATARQAHLVDSHKRCSSWWVRVFSTAATYPASTLDQVTLLLRRNNQSRSIAGEQADLAFPGDTGRFDCSSAAVVQLLTGLGPRFWRRYHLGC